MSPFPLRGGCIEAHFDKLSASFQSLTSCLPVLESASIQLSQPIGRGIIVDQKLLEIIVIQKAEPLPIGWGSTQHDVFVGVSYNAASNASLNFANGCAPESLVPFPFLSRMTKPGVPVIPEA